MTVLSVRGTKNEGLSYAAASRWMIDACGVQTERTDLIDAGCGTGNFSRPLIEIAGLPKCLTLLETAEKIARTTSHS